jgi:hypothetical protein
MKAVDDDESLFIPDSAPRYVQSGRATSAKTAPSINKKATSYFGTEPKWKQPIDNRMQLLATKEKAAENGLLCLENMLSILKDQKEESLSRIAQLWADRIGISSMSFTTTL